MISKNPFNFHIPVMGLAYTIDSPIRVAHLGISSVISIMDDELIERVNAYYSKQFALPYNETTTKELDYRARRITNYLNTVNRIVKEKFNSFKNLILEETNPLFDFMNLLPKSSDLKKDIQNYLDGHLSINELRSYLEEKFSPGSIDVNIMTKVDREQYEKKEKLAEIYNDAHAALRGFAKSTVNGSVVLSAGMNPKLYSYFEDFDCFYPDQNGVIEKKVILKVSDYRSAYIQGQQLAKRGIWVSEYRIESGLNCGGHAFATDGQLFGMILEEFNNKRKQLEQTTFEMLCKALEDKHRTIPKNRLPIQITAQGGVGTSEEHNFLLQHYGIDSVGWGSPFLLVPEATSTDKATRDLLAHAKEEDLYLSSISPLGIPFNTIKGTSNERFRLERIAKGRPGSSCPRKYLALDKTYDTEGTCTASRKHQELSLAILEKRKNAYNKEVYQRMHEEITEKSCLCIGLANAALMDLKLPIKGENQGIVICPGPNIAYFTKEATLQQMTAHINGDYNLIETPSRPHFFIKELDMYRQHYFKLKEEASNEVSSVKQKKLKVFQTNLLNSINYYIELFTNEQFFFTNQKSMLLAYLENTKKQL